MKKNGRKDVTTNSGGVSTLHEDRLPDNESFAAATSGRPSVSGSFAPTPTSDSSGGGSLITGRPVGIRRITESATGRFGKSDSAGAGGDESYDGGAAVQNNTWEAKYKALYADYETLLTDFEALLTENEQLSAKVAQIPQLEAELATYKKQQMSSTAVAAAQQHTSPQHSPNSGKKIEALNDEIQRLLEQRIGLETELAELKLRSPSARRSFQHNGGESAFELEREINNLRAEVREKNEEIEELNGDLAAARAEIARLGGAIGVVAHQVERSEKKKKKGWFGGSSSKKKKYSNELTAAELDQLAQDASFIAGQPAMTEVAFTVSNDKHNKDGHRPAASVIMPAASTVGGGPPRILVSGPPADMAMNKRTLELERENARLLGEIQILQKEKAVIMEKCNRLEAQHECLTASIANVEAQRKAIEISQCVAVPMPRDGGSEGDQLRALVRLQEAALRKLGLQNQHLEHALRAYGAEKLPDERGGLGAREREEFQQQGREVSSLKLQLAECRREVASKTAVAAVATAEAEQLRRSFASAQQSSAEASKKLKEQLQSQARMLTDLMKENERLLALLQQQRSEAMASARHANLRERALNDGRVADFRIPLFQSPPVQAASMPLPLRARCDGSLHATPFPSSSTSNTMPPAVVHQTNFVLQPPLQQPYELSSESSGPPLSQQQQSPAANKLIPPPSVTDVPNVFEYRWTNEGYSLRPMQQSADEHDSSQDGYLDNTSVSPRVRPAVTVEAPGATQWSIKEGGPFPPEGGILDVPPAWKNPAPPEVTELDQARCQEALKAWIRSPSSERRELSGRPRRSSGSSSRASASAVYQQPQLPPMRTNDALPPWNEQMQFPRTASHPLQTLEDQFDAVGRPKRSSSPPPPQSSIPPRPQPANVALIAPTDRPPVRRPQNHNDPSQGDDDSSEHGGSWPVPPSTRPLESFVAVQSPAPSVFGIHPPSSIPSTIFLNSQRSNLGEKNTPSFHADQVAPSLASDSLPDSSGSAGTPSASIFRVPRYENAEVLVDA